MIINLYLASFTNVYEKLIKELKIFNYLGTEVGFNTSFIKIKKNSLCNLIIQCIKVNGNFVGLFIYKDLAEYQKGAN